MAENQNQPNDGEAVLGGNTSEPVNSDVLGGIEEVKSRLANGYINQKIAALREAINYGQEGLYLIIQSLDSETYLEEIALSLLKNNKEPQAKQFLAKYEDNPKYARLVSLLLTERWEEAELVIQSLVDRGRYYLGDIALSLLENSEEPLAKQVLARSQCDPKFARLVTLLVTEQWEEAEEETETLILKLAGATKGDDIQTILSPRPEYSQHKYTGEMCKTGIECNISWLDSRTLCDLWDKYSKGKDSFNQHKSSLKFWNEWQAEIRKIHRESKYLYDIFREDERDIMNNMYGGDR
ncbi:MAG: hypothetical protein KME19_21350 [Microcoleus vaginatus WJT46-NPBG5]|nr:hypothetical protein [Microcoleus vaginatus WJT46-NPBG5]